MRFPFSLTRSITAYLLRKKLAGEKVFPLVLILEPLHASNLSGAGCGRSREYADTIHRRLSVEQCLAAVTECGATVVSLCGGEPLIHPDLTTLVETLVRRQKHVYLCTNGILLEKQLLGFRPSSRLFISVRLDGMEATHDRLSRQEGVFAAAIRGILDAKVAGFTVFTETTIYQDTNLHEIAVLFNYLYELGVDGFMLSPAFGDPSLPERNLRGGRSSSRHGQEVHEKFRAARALLRRFRLTTSPLYMEFLCGERELNCAALTNPTYNVQGWRGPCYLLGDAPTDLPGIGRLDRVERSWARRAIPAAHTAWCLAASSPPRCCRPARDPARCRMAMWQMT